MKNEIPALADLPEQSNPGANGTDKRVDPRCSFVVQAFVAIHSMPSRAYEICEVSRGGMFLAFRDARSTRIELEQNHVAPGTDLEVAFTASQNGTRYRIRVRARIVRITSQGIGVRFGTRNPPQLAPLRELFPAAGERVEYKTQSVGGRESRARKIFSAPPDAAAWQDWELLD